MEEQNEAFAVLLKMIYKNTKENLINSELILEVLLKNAAKEGNESYDDLVEYYNQRKESIELLMEKKVLQSFASNSRKAMDDIDKIRNQYKK